MNIILNVISALLNNMSKTPKTSREFVSIEHINYMHFVCSKTFYVFDASSVECIQFFRRLLKSTLSGGPRQILPEVVGNEPKSSRLQRRESSVSPLVTNLVISRLSRVRLVAALSEKGGVGEA